jgi:nitroreductase
VEVTEAIRRRRMVRSFAASPIDTAVLDRLLEDSLRGPSAGNTRGVAWVVLSGEETATYWDHATTVAWRGGATRYPGLSRAPVIALSVCSPAAYVERYSEEDKASSGLGSLDSDGGGGGGGGGGEAWPVPYWFGDAAFSTMLLLVGATAAGLGAAFLGNFRGEEPLLGALGVPPGWRLFGAVLLGYPDGNDHPSASLSRVRDADGLPVNMGRWNRNHRADAARRTNA